LARRGWHVAGEYVDQGISGSVESRLELNRLMADARKRRFDVVACWRFDRFARSFLNGAIKKGRGSLRLNFPHTVHMPFALLTMY
jgi:DNA invertase Pin-like site-specific DNA recombinase